MSDLRAAACDYLALRRALGFKLLDAERLLHQFVDHLEERGVSNITTAVALEWATSPPGSKPWWWRQRLGVVRGFARHLAAVDPTVEVPPAGLIHSPVPRATPYLFSEADVTSVMQAAGQLDPALRGATYRTLIVLLAVTGMRAGEAIGLEDGDVDVDEEVVVVHRGKFGKSRELIVDSTTTQALANYRDFRREELPRPSCAAYFVSTVGTRLHYPNVSALFGRLVDGVGLDRSPVGRPAHLHDLRHSFALRTVVGWYSAGLDVAPRMAALSIYLGHVDPAHTYWYLSATPDLLGLAAQRLEECSEVLP